MKIKRTRRILSAERKRMRMGYVFCLPLIIGLLVMFIPNIIQTIIFTLNDVKASDGGYSLSWIGLDYYRKALTENPNFIIHLTNSLRYLFTTLPVVTIFSLFIAVVINQKFKGRLLVRTIFFIPVLLATGVVVSVEETSNLMGMIANSSIDTGTNVDWSQLQGLKNVLLNLNFNDKLISIIAYAADSIYTIVQISGIQIMILLAGLQEISPSIYEAAKVEGCDSWSLFWKITFPMIMPQLIVCGVYTVVDAYSSINNTLSAYAATYVNLNQFGYATAMNFIYFAIVAVVLAAIAGLMSRVGSVNE